MACLVAMVVPCAAETRFSDVTGPAGLLYRQSVAKEPPDCVFGTFCEPERMSGGAAVADVDGDGELDLFVTRLDAPDLMFLNNGDGSFRDASAVSGLGLEALPTNGAAFGDIDNDGDPDLYLTLISRGDGPAVNRNHLFVNDGAGHFTEQALQRGAAIEDARGRRGYGVTFGDFDRDGWLDVHTNEWFPSLPSHGRLLRNSGARAPGHFVDVTAAAGVELTAAFAFASALTDLDDDGWPDLAVAADFGTSRLFWNNRDGTFADGTIEAGVGTDENGMGSTVGDYDGDGDLDWFVTSIHDAEAACDSSPCNWGYSGNRLYRNEGGRSFTDVTDLVGVREGFWGWGAAFFDMDNDGDLDLVMANGIDFPGTSGAEVAFNTDPLRLWENLGDGTMREVSASAGLTDLGSGKGLLVFDYDRDGDQDLFVVNNAGFPRLYRNDTGNARDWLRVRLVGTRSNREGIGARVKLAHPGGMLLREISSVSHFLGQSERVAHFGLGQIPAEAPLVLEVRWPAGPAQRIEGVTRNTTLTLREPSGPPDRPARFRQRRGRRGP